MIQRALFFVAQVFCAGVGACVGFLMGVFVFAVISPRGHHDTVVRVGEGALTTDLFGELIGAAVMSLVALWLFQRLVTSPSRPSP